MPRAGRAKHQHRGCGVERIDHFLEDQRTADVGELCGGQKGQSDRHARAEFPEIRDEHADGAPLAARLRRFPSRGGQGETAVIVSH